MKSFLKVLAAFSIFASFSFSSELFAQAKRDSDIAFDSINNRYLMVWEEDGSGESNILAQFHGVDGSAVGSPVVISDPRPTQGCFYGQFDEQNGEITTPTNCSQNKNPSVAYNNGQFLIVWEVHGSANAPSSAPDNQFVNIFAQIVNANNLEPLSGWSEGILISKVFIAANNASSQCGDRHACNDSQIQAWSKSINPDVAPRVGGQGFVATWQTNKDFIGCADPKRRQAWSVYGRYIDQNFSATSTSNPPAFAVFKDDSTAGDTCEPISNVDNGTNPRVAANQTTNDFVIAYKVARANGGNGSIGAKRVTLDGSNVGQTNGSMMPDIVASVKDSSLGDPEVLSFKDQYMVFASDGTNIRGKAFNSSAISPTEPMTIDLGSGFKASVRAASNLGIGGRRSIANSSPERILIAYENGGDILIAALREDMSVGRGPENISSDMGDSNRAVEVGSDTHHFLVSWTWKENAADQVYAKLVHSEDDGSIALLTPNDGVTLAPIRVFLSWNTPTGGATTYRIYLGETMLPATPQAIGITTTNFVIGPETESITGITLEPNKTYKWKVEADNGQGEIISSPIRTFVTDNSVIGWWRFDENPAGQICTGGGLGETVCDSSGYDNHGIPNGNPMWLSPSMPDILLGAINLDGVNDFISIQNSLSLNPNSITVIAKIKTNGKTGEQQLVDKRGTALASYNLRVQGSSFPLNVLWVVRDSFSVDHVINSGNVIFNATTYQLVATYNAMTGDANIYVDGSLVASQNFGVLNISSKSTASLILGDAVGAPSVFAYKGIVDEIIIMDRISNMTEIINNYSSID